MADAYVTVVGNITSDPELRFMPNGDARASFTVAQNSRKFDRETNQWVDGDSTFFDCTVWRAYAENVADSLKKGMRVVVHGKLQVRNYETREGEKRTAVQINVEEVGPSLRYATAQVTKTSNNSGGGGGGTSWQSNNSGGDAHDPWASSGSADNRAANDPWAQSNADEPPF